MPSKDAQATTEAAIEVGYRHFDTASIYGNEHEVGEAIAISTVPRAELFVTTKLWNRDHGRKRAREAFERSREALGLEVIDLYLIHWPVPALGLYRETWETLQELRSEGCVRAIGVSNFLPEHLDKLLESGGERPSVNQIELHPRSQERELASYHEEFGIVTQAYSPLAHGGALQSLALRDVAHHLAKSVAQVILRWHVQRGRVIIPKTVNPMRMRENLDIFAFALPDDVMQMIDGLDRGERMSADPREFLGLG
ncbi:aldo/keto reductase [Microbacterium trichothecenolyticum]|uniref:aldo/keto reductase n=1 Tax=Microbacterium trichothecenolyticum TaxID=69370 RepID=UPI0027E28FD5|nr:aldo/keto reductase [Microbacterium trichothecenolyticum]